jgi:amino acid transporter
VKRIGVAQASLFAVVAMLSVRWLAVAAAAGVSSLPLWLLAFALFHIPLSLAIAELTSRFPGDASLYGWVRGVLGPRAGFLCGWAYWLALFPYFASLIYFVAGLAVSATGSDRDPALFLAISIALVVALTAVQLFGLGASRWLTSAGAAGAWIVVGLFFAAAAVVVARGDSATRFADGPWLATPSAGTAILWSTMVFGVCGGETIGFLRGHIAGGMRGVVRALAVVAAMLFVAYVAGTAAVLAILRPQDVTHLSGLPDTIRAALAQAGLDALGTVGVALFAASMIGALAAWFGIAPRLPMEAGLDRFLPPVFARRHPRTGAPVAAILLQAVLTLGVVVLGQAGETAEVAYDLLVQLSVLTVAIPYLLVFVAYARRSRWAQRAGDGDVWLPPGGATTGRVAAAVGIAANVAAIACTLVPEPGAPHPIATLLKIAGTAAVAMVVGLVLYELRRAPAPA